MRPILVLPFSALLLAACSVSPAAKAPLRDALAKAEMADVESAVRGCLTQGGWKVDDVGSYSGGANVVTAYKAKDQTDVYIYGADQKPRITGGPDDSNPFWKCLGTELAGGGGGDKDTDKAKDGDKPGKGDDKGGGDKGNGGGGNGDKGADDKGGGT
ncbi:MAG TPA: hypothetical protein VH309_08115 [Elusimicrobiota bacterium]|jgi:hypothetical protein|nr:hypothetical protein [Elusimicrobiota bacterium]